MAKERIVGLLVALLVVAAIIIAFICKGWGNGEVGNVVQHVEEMEDTLVREVEPEPVIEIDDEALGLRQRVRAITEIVVHCSASGDDYDYPMDSLYKGHRQRGFRNIGYHYYVTKDGVVHKCRDLTVPGAHVRGHNAKTIGICYEGGLRRAKDVKGMENIRIPDELKDAQYSCFKAELPDDTIVATVVKGKLYVAFDTRTKAQKMALSELIAHLKVIYPNAKVCGHRDYSPDKDHDGIISPKERIKDCPSFDVIGEY